jgi:prolyl oligopeptidase
MADGECGMMRGPFGLAALPGARMLDSKTWTRSLTALLIAALMSIAPCTAMAQRADGAPVAKVDRVVEELHGVTVSDPYRYLEDVKRPDVRAWMEDQSTATAKLLATIDGRDALLARLNEVTAAAGDRIADVWRMPGERYYYLKRARSERQYKLVMRQGLGGTERTLVDPEVESRAHGVPHAVNFFAPSWDGRYVAFGMSAGGSEDATLYVLDVSTGKRVGEPLPRMENSPVHWLPDSRSFTVNQLQALRPGQPETDTYKYSRVLWQHVGARAAAAKPVFGPGVTRSLGLNPIDNGELITVPGSAWMVARTTDTTVPEGNLFVAPLAQLGRPDVRWQRIATAADKITKVSLRGDELFVMTYNGAPRRRLLAIDLRRPELARAVEAVSEPQSGVLEDFQLKPGGVVSQMRQGTALSLREHVPGDLVGRPIALPYPGAAWLVHEPAPVDDALLFSLTGWTRWQRYYVARGGAIAPVAFGVEPALPPLDLQVTEVEVPSHDGVKVPMTVLHKKGLVLDGRNPVLVHGYASYGHSMTAYYSPDNLVWLERGGVLAFTNPRGSGVRGEEWHRAGFKSTKSNTWKDGIACVRWLIAQKYGSPATMAISGTSAGGIFVGRAVTAAPELFAAAIFNVGTLDALRFETSANGATNISEFGSVTDPNEFRALLDMSTYYAVHDGTAYPAVMLVHGVNDPRVPVWESAKTAARLQEATASGKPILLRLDMQAGHGMGSTVTQRNSAVADQYAFMLWQMGKLARRD